MAVWTRWRRSESSRESGRTGSERQTDADGSSRKRVALSNGAEMTKGAARALAPQPWDWPSPRVLLEQPEGTNVDRRIEALRRAGYAVAICPGPAAEARCPLAGDEGCAAAAGADVVVSSLGQETAQAREALAALRERLPGRPLLIEADGNAGGRWPELLAGCELLAVGATPAQLAARIGGLLKRQAGVGA